MPKLGTGKTTRRSKKQFDIESINTENEPKNSTHIIKIIENYPDTKEDREIYNKTIAKLLSANPDYDVNKTVGKNKDTALLLAVAAKLFAVIFILMRFDKTDVNLGNKDGLNPLKLAVCNIYNHKMVQFLLKNPKIDVNHNISMETPLGLACEIGEVETVKELLKHPLIDLFIGWHNYPLAYACKNGNPEIVKLLIDHDRSRGGNGQRIQDGLVRGNIYELPIDLACENGHLNVVKLLIEKYNFQYNIVSNSDGNYPISTAYDRNHMNIVKYLLTLSDIHLSINRSSMLSDACNAGDVQTVESLLKIDNIDPNVDGILDKGLSMNEYILEMLLKDGRIDLHSKDHRGNTFLMKALYDEWYEKVKLAVDYDPTTIYDKNSEGQNAMDIINDLIKHNNLSGDENCRKMRDLIRNAALKKVRRTTKKVMTLNRLKRDPPAFGMQYAHTFGDFKKAQGKTLFKNTEECINAKNVDGSEYSDMELYFMAKGYGIEFPDGIDQHHLPSREELCRIISQHS